MNKADKPKSVPMTARVREILERRRIKGVKPFDMTENQINPRWNKARRAMGLMGEDFVPHALRHTTATRLLNGGVDLYTVKEFLGHSTIAVTERYAHLAPRKLENAAKVLER